MLGPSLFGDLSQLPELVWLDAFFKAYADFNAGRPDSEWKPFLDWVAEDYDRLKVKEDFLRDFGKGIQVDRILQRE